MLSERQQQIIKESIKLIDSKGIQGFTIKNLSKEIGISEPGIYRHFESKFAILNEILDSFKQNLIENQKTFTKNDADPLTKLKLFFNKLFLKFNENPALISVIFSEEIFQNEKLLSEKVNEIHAMNEQMVSSVFNDLQSSKQISEEIDIETFNLMLFGSVRLLVRKWRYSGHKFNIMEKGNELFITLLKLAK
ncbi:MAG: TetR family transcriptional regulator [Bacteroidales bacterium]|nr:TetR family transcriptional regulator [Bacteroidales bacterium]